MDVTVTPRYIYYFLSFFLSLRSFVRIGIFIDNTRITSAARMVPVPFIFFVGSTRIITSGIGPGALSSFLALFLFLVMMMTTMASSFLMPDIILIRQRRRRGGVFLIATPITVVLSPGMWFSFRSLAIFLAGSFVFGRVPPIGGGFVVIVVIITPLPNTAVTNHYSLQGNGSVPFPFDRQHGIDAFHSRNNFSKYRMLAIQMRGCFQSNLNDETTNKSSNQHDE
jgi:hypothetical protein